MAYPTSLENKGIHRYATKNATGYTPKVQTGSGTTRLISVGKRKPKLVSKSFSDAFDISSERLNSRSTYFGERRGLYRATIDVDTSAIAKYSLDVQRAIANVMMKLAREARDKARKAAPSRSGALRAGIYITNAPSAAELKSIADGNVIQQTKSAGHSKGYFAAISAAARRKGTSVPAQPDKEGNLEGVAHFLVNPRTQRPLAANRKAEREAVSLQTVKSLIGDKYSDLAEALPFNPLPKAGMETFFVGLGSAMYYSAWVEFGTSRQRANPFFTPAAQWMTSNAPIRMAEAMRNVKVKPIATRNSKR